jgi:hypothetical protein
MPLTLLLRLPESKWPEQLSKFWTPGLERSCENSTRILSLQCEAVKSPQIQSLCRRAGPTAI